MSPATALQGPVNFVRPPKPGVPASVRHSRAASPGNHAWG
jgi:hypothetical protein